MNSFLCVSLVFRSGFLCSTLHFVSAHLRVNILFATFWNIFLYFCWMWGLVVCMKILHYVVRLFLNINICSQLRPVCVLVSPKIKQNSLIWKFSESTVYHIYYFFVFSKLSTLKVKVVDLNMSNTWFGDTHFHHKFKEASSMRCVHIAIFSLLKNKK